MSDATIDLIEVEWTDQPRNVNVTYPAAPVIDFLNWLRGSKAWWEDVELVHRRVRKLNADLAAIRSAQAVVKPPVNAVAPKVTKRTRKEA